MERVFKGLKQSTGTLLRMLILYLKDGENPPGSFLQKALAQDKWKDTLKDIEDDACLPTSFSETSLLPL